MAVKGCNCNSGDSLAGSIGVVDGKNCSGIHDIVVYVDNRLVEDNACVINHDTGRCCRAGGGFNGGIEGASSADGTGGGFYRSTGTPTCSITC